MFQNIGFCIFFILKQIFLLRCQLNRPRESPEPEPTRSKQNRRWKEKQRAGRPRFGVRFQCSTQKPVGRHWVGTSSRKAPIQASTLLL